MSLGCHIHDLVVGSLTSDNLMINNNEKIIFFDLFPFAASLGWSQNAVVSWDSLSLSMDHHRVLPVMGEVHYSRIPASEWRNELLKMKEGGVTFVATYVF